MFRVSRSLARLLFPKPRLNIRALCVPIDSKANIVHGDNEYFSSSTKKSETEMPEKFGSSKKINGTTNFINSVFSTGNLHELLKFINISSLTETRALLILIHLNTLNVDLGSQSDVNYIQLCKKINEVMDFWEDVRNCNTLEILHKVPIYKIIKLLTDQCKEGMRNPNLLWPLLNTLCNHPQGMNVVNCAEVLFAMAKLKLFHEELLEKVGDDFIKYKGALISLATSSSIIKSLGIMRCRHIPILDLYVDSFLTNHENLNARLLPNLLTTCALVNYKSDKLISLVKIVSDKMKPDGAISNSNYLRWVWSLSLLDLVKESDLKIVLAEEFLRNMIHINERTMKLQLLNINGYAKWLLKNYDGPFLTDLNFTGMEKTVSPLHEAAIEALDYMSKGLINVRQKVDSKAGFTFDAEFYVDANGKVLPLTNNDGGIKIGLLVLDYDSYCFPKSQVQPTGVAKFYEKILEAQGYHVLILSSFSFHHNAAVEKRVDFLQYAIKNMISHKNQPEMAKSK